MIVRDFEGKRILLGICGGIAAYKAAYLVRELTELGAEVQVVMTDSAQAFITPMTLQALSGRAVRCTLFDEEAERAMGHIELARWADACVIAPASANMMAKLAYGMADDLLSTLALVLEVPLLICPAMNQSMWKHPAVQTNLETLRSRGVQIVGPGEGAQACGETGFGRMSEVHSIISALRLHDINQCLYGKRVLITAGPTYEAIDPVRYVGNRSSGKMGYALAEATKVAGADVILISGPSTLTPPEGVTMIRVETAAEMHQAVMDALEPGMVFIGAAAVSDYCVDRPSDKKIKKQGTENRSLNLTLNPDILTDVVTSKKALFVMGFAAETDDMLTHAREKLQRKKLDCIVANWVGAGRGFDVDIHEVTVITQETEHVLPHAHKVKLAGELVAIIATSLQNSDHRHD
jgi:phosphopantothenoylcysteine decarboxylase / phosphopantothenate---cysteine ligase